MFVLVLMVAAALLIQGMLRGWVAGELLTAGMEGQFGGLVHWRVFDQITGWVALIILAMPDAGTGRGRILVRWILAAGLTGLVATLLWGEVGGRAMAEIGVAVLLAMAAALVVGRQMIRLAREMQKGLNIEQLWRGIAAQWVLVWVTAEMILRVRFWKDGVEAERMARTRLILLPMVGVSVNVMMAMGIRWWGSLRGRESSTGVRVRAWMVAMAMVNSGAILVIAGAVWARGLGVAGAGLMIASVALYLVGFPRNAWRGGGLLVPLAFATLILALAMMAGEFLLQPGNVLGLEWYSASWRHLLASVEVLWLAGIGGIALRQRVPTLIAAGARGPALASASMLPAGILFTAGTFAMAINDREIIRGLFVGAALQLAGVAVGTAVALRAGRAIQTAAP